MPLSLGGGEVVEGSRAVDAYISLCAEKAAIGRVLLP